MTKKHQLTIENLSAQLHFEQERRIYIEQTLFNHIEWHMGLFKKRRDEYAKTLDEFQKREREGGMK